MHDTFPPFLSSVQAKASGKKLQKVTLKVSPRGIILYDSASNQLMENVSIYRLVVSFDSLIYASPSQFGRILNRPHIIVKKWLFPDCRHPLDGCGCEMEEELIQIPSIHFLTEM